MNTNTLVAIVIVILVIVAGGFFLLRDGSQSLPPDMNEAASEDMNSGGAAGTIHEDDPDASSFDDTPGSGIDASLDANVETGASAGRQTATITYTDEGFEPGVLTIERGTTVTFVNESSRNVWPATDVHPTHTVYPGSDIKKCSTAPEGTLFDACRGLSPDESWSFTFMESGSWGYHNHLRASQAGVVKVN